MRLQVSHDFFIDEFVPPDIWERFENSSTWFVDSRLIGVAQFLRDHFGVAMVINDWWDGGLRRLSGFRPPGTTIGAGLSQHKFGRAIDIHFKGLDPYEVRKEIRKLERYFYQGGVRAVEMATPTWVHIDIRETKKLLWLPYV